MMVDLFKVKLKGKILKKLEDGLALQVLNIWKRKVKDGTIKLLIKDNLSFMRLKDLLDPEELNEENDLKHAKKLAKKEDKDRKKLKDGDGDLSSSGSSSSYGSEDDEDSVEESDFIKEVFEDKLE